MDLTTEEALELKDLLDDDDDESSEYYDVIVVINRHGGIGINKMEDFSCKMITIPNSMTINFLEAVPCGTCNFSVVNWAGRVIPMMESLLDNKPDKPALPPSQRFVNKVKDFLLHLVEETKGNFRVPMNDIYKPENKKELMQDSTMLFLLRSWNKWLKTDHWKQKVFSKSFDNRIYSDTSYIATQVLKINKVIHSTIPKIPKGDIPIEINDRRDLIKYLYEGGSINPLIIDSSCGGISSTPIDEGTFARYVEKNAKGGKMKRKSKKRKQTKRKY